MSDPNGDRTWLVVKILLAIALIALLAALATVFL